MFTKVFCAYCIGIEAITITVEVNVSQGITFNLVGLPDSAVKESKQRIGTALLSVSCKIPGKRIVINLAPADIRKVGSSFDLAIAIGIIEASGQHHFPSLESYIFAGELSLDGNLRAISGALSISEHAVRNGFKKVILPYESAQEASLINGVRVYGARNLEEVISILLNDPSAMPFNYPVETELNLENDYEIDFSQIKGQAAAKRGVEIAAAGGHNLLLSGIPGIGKSMLAKAIPSILPKMSLEEAIETTKIYSIAGKVYNSRLMFERPFRNPHHSTTITSISGGGVNSSPGEVSLAHNGVLYLDELPEFPRRVLEFLRQPLEDRVISVSRLKNKIKYPANFMLVASMNPCPCGYFGDSTGRCSCTASSIVRYRSRVSGPVLDRIDLRIDVLPVSANLLISNREEESSAIIRERVALARVLQRDRFKGRVETNSNMSLNDIKTYCSLNNVEQKLLSNAAEKLNLSARGFNKILKVARTIADLDAEEKILSSHLSEAINLRGVL